jgi:glycosyltransferase involved in cell wall biosynthesis
MRVLYLSVSYVPSRSASGVHAMKMCAALTREGHTVELVTKFTPDRLEPDVDNDFAFYGVTDGFSLIKLPRPVWRGGGLVFLRAVHRLLSQKRDLDLVYSRDLVAAWLAARSGHRVIFEAHGLPSGRFGRFVAARLLARPELQRVVFISRALEQLWRTGGLLPSTTVTLIAHDASDPLPSGARRSRDESSRLRAGYIGHLYAGRGVELILEMARQLPEIDFCLVGGRERDLAAWRAAPSPDNVAFHGFAPPSELPSIYQGFDLLLMPYQRSVGVRSGRSDTAQWMSPMKMFEYLASGRAIVSSDLPVLREVLEHEGNALLADPEDPDAWRRAIERLAADEPLRERLGRRAREDFERHYTWTARAKNVLADIDP